MKPVICFSSQFGKGILFLILIVVLIAPASFAQHKEKYEYTYEEYQSKGRTKLIAGGIMIALGTLGTLTHNYESSDGIDLTPWPVLVPVGFAFCIDGTSKLIRRKKVKAGVKVEGMPALDKARITHPVIPSLGVQFSL